MLLGAAVTVAGGLALASAMELSFNAIGFLAALLNNGVDCIQNVFSKKLLMGRYSYVELQFYTSAAALVVQIPVWLVWYHDTIVQHAAYWLNLGSPETRAHDPADHVVSAHYVAVLLLDATSYHLQSVFAYGLMDLISPVTHSVANTVKRAVLIWLSVLFFGNPVSALSIIGTSCVVVGVFVYNWAREQEFAAKLSPMAEHHHSPGSGGGNGVVSSIVATHSPPLPPTHGLPRLSSQYDGAAGDGDIEGLSSPKRRPSHHNSTTSGASNARFPGKAFTAEPWHGVFVLDGCCVGVPVVQSGVGPAA